MRQLLLTCVAAVALATAAGAARDDKAVKGPSARSYAYAVIGVEDLGLALDLWHGRFGMEIAQRETGPDAELARVWGLPEDAIADQALLNAPGLLNGGVHLVQFATAAAPVRDGAQPADLAPQSIVVAVSGIEARYAELATDPGRFRSRLIERTADRATFHELHMDTHDSLDIVFREQLRRPEIVVGKNGYAAAPSIILTTSDLERDVAFFREVLGLEIIGSGQGATRVLGARDSRFGRVELVQSADAGARDLYGRTVPPARGLISLTYVVADLKPIVTGGRAAGLAEHGRVRSIIGEGLMASVASPSGLRIDIIQL
jgi:catechol 2,3-dioxygenase-like lactoylglutathione lyase family enzyme